MYLSDFNLNHFTIVIFIFINFVNSVSTKDSVFAPTHLGCFKNWPSLSSSNVQMVSQGITSEYCKDWCYQQNVKDNYIVIFADTKCACMPITELEESRDAISLLNCYDKYSIRAYCVPKIEDEENICSKLLTKHSGKGQDHRFKETEKLPQISPNTILFQQDFTNYTGTVTSELTETMSPPGICVNETFCTSTDPYEQVWQVCTGETGKKPCPKLADGNATWFCQENGKFLGDMPDYTNCSNKWISDIKKQIEEGILIPPIQAYELVNSISEKTKAGGYFGHEIKKILELSTQVLGQVPQVDLSEFENLTDNTWDIFGDILSARNQWTELSNENRSEAGTDFLLSLEKASLELAYRASVNGTSTNLEILEYNRRFSKFPQFQLLSGVQVAARTSLTFPKEYSEEDSHLNLPSDWSAYFDELKVKFVGIEIKPDEANRIFPGNLNVIGPNGTSSTGKIVNSNIMGFSFGALKDQFKTRREHKTINQTIVTQRINFTGQGVRITLRHDRLAWGDEIADVRRWLHEGERHEAVLGSSVCVFWDPDSLVWSSEGCTVISSQREKTICECNHLTSFAVLMDLHNYIGKDSLLEILTLVLCPISIICLVLCLIILVKVESDRSPRNELTINLCMCLLIGNLLVIFVMDKYYFNLSDGLCVASAVMLHYVFLCAFMWMGLEGFLIFKSLFLDILSQGKDYLKVQHGLAYGIPAIIVAVTGLIDGLSNDQGYGNDSFCWLNGSYLWAFMGPVAVILALNVLVLIFSFRKAYILFNKKQKSARRKGKSCLSWLKSCTFLIVSFGLTWVFGYLMAVNNSAFANVAAYIFTILNASQGIFLFIVHGVMNPGFRYKVRRYLRRFAQESNSNRNASTTTQGPSFGSRFQQFLANMKNSILHRSSEEIDSGMPDLVVPGTVAPQVQTNSAKFVTFA